MNRSRLGRFGLEAGVACLLATAVASAQAPTSSASRRTTDSAALIREARDFLRDERAADALALLDRVRTAEPRNVEAAIFAGEAHFISERYADAVRLYGEAVALDPSAAPQIYNHGAALLKLGRPAEALDRFKLVAEKAPRPEARARGVYGIGAALSDSGDDDGAIVRFEEALRLDPNLVRAKYRLGVAKLKRGDAAAAIRYLSEVVAADLLYEGAAYNLALAYGAAKDEANAALWRRKFAEVRALKNEVGACKMRLATDPTHVPSLHALAKASVSARLPKQALRYYARAFAAGADGAILREYAELLEASGEAAEAALVRARLEATKRR